LEININKPYYSDLTSPLKFLNLKSAARAVLKEGLSASPEQ